MSTTITDLSNNHLYNLDLSLDHVLSKPLDYGSNFSVVEYSFKINKGQKNLRGVKTRLSQNSCVQFRRFIDLSSIRLLLLKLLPASGAFMRECLIIVTSTEGIFD